MYSAGPSSKPLAPVFHKSGGSASAAARANSLAEAKRRLDRACDQCRRRKTKCDGATKTDNICSNCLQNHHRCTYMYVPLKIFVLILALMFQSFSEGSKPRGPPKAYVNPDLPEAKSDLCSHHSYVTSLEDRLERMEALLKRVSCFQLVQL